MRKQSTILEIKSLSLLILLFGSLPLLAVEAVFVDTKINLDLEIAKTDSKRKRGLMFRDQLEKNQGMIFIWSDSDTRCMWMKNTSIPLSVAYLSKSGHILEIHDLKPNNNTYDFWWRIKTEVIFSNHPERSGYIFQVYDK